MASYQLYPQFQSNPSDKAINKNSDSRTWQIELDLLPDDSVSEFLQKLFKQIPFKSVPDWNMIIDTLVVEDIEKNYDILELWLTLKQNSSAHFIVNLLRIFNSLDDYYDDKSYFIYLIDPQER